MLRGKRLAYFAIAVIALAVAACKGSNSSTNNPPVVCTTNDCPVPVVTFSGGATTTLTIVSSSVFNSYAGRPVNPTSAIQLNLQVAPINNVFYGQLNIGYYEGSAGHMGHFINGDDTTCSQANHGSQSCNNGVHILTTDSSSGLPTYRFFFEDPAGDIIITAQSTSGTDTSTGSLSGNIYFRNFNTTAPNPLYQSYYDPNTGFFFAENPAAFCWTGIITNGPYDCRNSNVQPSTSGNGAVTLLGTFTGMDKKTALGL